MLFLIFVQYILTSRERPNITKIEYRVISLHSDPYFKISSQNNNLYLSQITLDQVTKDQIIKLIPIGSNEYKFELNNKYFCICDNDKILYLCHNPDFFKIKFANDQIKIYKNNLCLYTDNDKLIMENCRGDHYGVNDYLWQFNELRNYDDIGVNEEHHFMDVPVYMK